MSTDSVVVVERMKKYTRLTAVGIFFFYYSSNEAMSLMKLQKHAIYCCVYWLKDERMKKKKIMKCQNVKMMKFTHTRNLVLLLLCMIVDCVVDDLWFYDVFNVTGTGTGDGSRFGRRRAKWHARRFPVELCEHILCKENHFYRRAHFASIDLSIHRCQLFDSIYLVIFSISISISNQTNKLERRDKARYIDQKPEIS